MLNRSSLRAGAPTARPDRGRPADRRLDLGCAHAGGHLPGPHGSHRHGDHESPGMAPEEVELCTVTFPSNRRSTALPVYAGSGPFRGRNLGDLGRIRMGAGRLSRASGGGGTRAGFDPLGPGRGPELGPSSIMGDHVHRAHLTFRGGQPHGAAPRGGDDGAAKPSRHSGISGDPHRRRRAGVSSRARSRRSRPAIREPG